MRKTTAIIGSAVFLVIAPGTLALYLPYAWTRWRLAPPLLGFFFFRVIGVIFIAAGLPVLLDSFRRFAVQGLGTPAPIAPPQKLVVTGLYRHVRNPIYIAVVGVILGQALLLGDVRLFWYGALFWLYCHIVVVLYEEPTLKQ